MRRRFMLGMALVALSAAAIARASALPVHANVATPPAPPGAVYGGSSSQHHPMSLRLTHDGRQLKVMFVRVDARNCSSSPERVYNAALNEDYSHKDVRLQADGRFATTTTLRGREEGGGRNEFEFTVRGKAGRTGAFGTLRALAVFFDANDNVVDRCDTGAVRWSLRRGNVYGGRTSHYGALSIRVGPDRARVRSFFIDMKAMCGSTPELFSHDHVNIAVRPDGRFSKQGITGIRLEGPETSTISGRYSLRGRLRARVASGTYRAFGKVLTKDGTTLSCDTGLFRWTALRG